MDLSDIEGLTADQIKAINSKHEADIDGLKSKNSELINSLKKTKTGSEEELKILREFKENAELEEAKRVKDFEKALSLKEEQFNKKLDELTSSKNDLNSRYEKIMIDNELSKQLDGLNIDKDFKDAVTALLRPQIQLKEGAAMASDKPMSEFLKEWAGSDNAKRFIKAPENNGGGAGGGDKSGGPELSHLSVTELGQQVKANKITADDVKAELQRRKSA
jgi:hypothetical protein